MKISRSAGACLWVIVFTVMASFFIISCVVTSTTTPTDSSPITEVVPEPYSAPILISPANGEPIVGETLTEFSWQWDGDLKENEVFGLRMWKSDKAEPHDPFDMLRDCSRRLDTPPDGFGEYLWRVVVVQIGENGDQSTLSESGEWSFAWSAPAPALTRPRIGETIVGKQVTEFSWQWGGVLQEGESYSLRIGQPEKPLTTFDRPRQCSCLLDEPPDGFGHYHWQVAVVRIDENGDESDLSKSSTWSFTWCGVTTVEDDEFPVVEDSDPTRLDVVKNDLVTPDTCEKPAIVAVGSGSAGGTISIADDNSIEYQPAPDFFGTETFTYTVKDDSALDGNATAVVTIKVKGVDDDPVASDDTTETSEDQMVSINVLKNDNDVDDDHLKVDSVAQQPINGSVIRTDANVIYNPKPDYCGEDFFSYKVSDGDGETDTATVTVTVTCVNDKPVAKDDAYDVKDSTLPVAAPGILDNDIDVDGDLLAANRETNVSHGELRLQADGSFTYTPNRGFHGSDNFTYRASDGELYSDIVTVTITVKPEDSPTPTPTVTPTTPALYPAPILQEPPNGEWFCPCDEFTLQWQWNGTFKPNEYYAVRIWHEDEGYEQSRHWEPDPTKQSFDVHLRPDGPEVPEEERYYQGTGIYYWNVIVLLDTGQGGAQDNKIWEPRSKKSEKWQFVVLPMTDPFCEPP